MDTPNDREKLLTSARLALVAKHADKRVTDQLAAMLPECAEPLSLENFSSFARHAWRRASHAEPLLITAIETLPQAVQQISEFTDADATARWAYPAVDSLGLPRQGELAGTSGPVAYIDVRMRSKPTRLVALHELAHLQVDSVNKTLGHGPAWANAYTELIEAALGPVVRALWSSEFDWWTEKAAEKVAADPNWLTELLR